MKYELLGKVTDGSLVISRAVLTEIAHRFDGKKVLVQVEPMEKETSYSQRGYYFAGVVNSAAEFFGWSKEDMHDYLKTECNKREIVFPTGEVRYIVGTTSGMSKKQYMEFIDRCIMRLAELGFVVETPEEYYRRKEREYEHSEKVAV